MKECVKQIGAHPTPSQMLREIAVLKAALADAEKENKRLKEELALSQIAFEMMDEMRAEAVTAQEAVHHREENWPLTTCAMNYWPEDTQTSTNWDDVTCAGCQMNRAKAAEYLLAQKEIKP